MSTDVLPTKPAAWTLWWIALMGTSTLTQLIVLAPIFVREWRKNFRKLFYICNFLAVTALFWYDCIFWIYEYKMEHKQMLCAILQGTPLEFITVLLCAIVVNVVLPSKTSESLYFNIAVLFSFLLSKAIMKSGAEDLAGAIGFARGLGLAFVFIVTWVGRYVGELQERANTVRILESHARVDRVKVLLRSRTEEGLNTAGKQQTPAERVVELLDQIHLTLNVVRDEGYNDHITACFDEVVHNVRDIMKALTSHESLMDLQAMATKHGSIDDSEEQIVLAFANPNRKLNKRVKIGEREENERRPSLSATSTNVSEIMEGDEYKMPDIIFRWKRTELGFTEEDMQKIGEDLDFSPDSISSPAGPLIEIGMAITRTKLSHLKRHIPEANIFQFLYTVDALTFANLHTNSAGAARSTHFFIKLIRTTGISQRLADMEKLTLLITSLARYVGYGGFGDKFLQSTCSRLTMAFNDRFVVSSMTASCLLKIATLPGADLWNHLDLLKKREHRKTVICLLMCLDYRVHFEVLSQVRLRRSSPEFDPVTDPEDRWLISRLCFKISDFNTHFSSWETHFKLEQRRTLELFEQGDVERRLGLPVTPLCDRGKFHLLPTYEFTFHQQIAVPYFEEVAALDKMGTVSQILLPRARANREQWERIKNGLERFDFTGFHRSHSAGVERSLALWFRVMTATCLNDIITEDLPSILFYHLLQDPTMSPSATQDFKRSANRTLSVKTQRKGR
eukprot:Gregarina_sp_Poly_1__10766@NODE_824_length_6127_cov_330_289274_g596_i0_p1_GENE_NODE_824_length_6127_cov_330_289274_g596_i0NODE_824_length_6127_cov_330_289274_g596_i0_p1_ORF_typecomplete_len734_score106_36PDEase_I/PF00233_19/7_2e36ECFribofla_trS/PF07155_12/0_092ASC/PF00858_24/0_21_NODE_824_length_6127_cov_330_289274_g596_i036195820